MGVRSLLSEEDTGVGGGARGPFARWDARVERRGLVGVREADRECASQFSHLLGIVGEGRFSWRSVAVRKILVKNKWIAANAARVVPRAGRKISTTRATAALNHTSYHLLWCLLDRRRLLDDGSGT